LQNLQEEKHIEELDAMPAAALSERAVQAVLAALL
jgi:hypothetical protein